MANQCQAGSEENAEEEPPECSSAAEPSSRVLFSAVLTLTLSILGSSVLPIPYAFSRLGVLYGLLTQLVVAICNATASVLLLDAASEVGHSSYEGVAEAIGGKTWKLLTQISLMALLFGTLVGDFALLGDVGNQAIASLTDSPPAWLDGEGRLIMTVLALAILPICCLRRMRSLEIAGTVGLSVILAVMAIIIYQSIAAGLPAISDGELPLWTIKLTGDLPEAMSVMGFAFYVTPMLLPLRSEIVAGPRGDRLTRRATILVVVGVAQIVYGSLGVFGAARHGLDTAGNILVNHWLPVRSQGILEVIIAIYLGISIPPISLSLRCTLECLIAGEGAPYSRRRHYASTVLPLLLSLAIALVSPQASEKIFAVTGATAVMLVCYLIPVALHLMLQNQRSKLPDLMRHETEREPLLTDTEALGTGIRRPSAIAFATGTIGPILVAVIGVGCSIAALAVAVSPFLSSSKQ